MVNRMKLIDVRALKEWVENWFTKNRFYHPYAKNNNIPITELYDILELIPSIDAAEVVRCKDCRWYKTNYMWNGTEVKICAKEAYEPGRNAYDYCSYGERK